MSENINEERWIPLQEVCYYLGVKRHTIMCCIKYCNMLASKNCKLWHFKTAEIDEWVKSDEAFNEWEVAE